MVATEDVRRVPFSFDPKQSIIVVTPVGCLPVWQVFGSLVQIAALAKREELLGQLVGDLVMLVKLQARETNTA